MEIGLRFLGALQVLANILTLPYFYFLSFKTSRKLPPIRNELLTQSATTLARKIRRREVRSEDVVAAFISRIKEVNGVLNAVVEDRFEAALEDARAVDALIASGKKSEEELELETPFLGVPITVKESCCLKGMSYAVGSLIRNGMKASEDGEAVQNIKKTGAIPIAVTNTPEWCLSWESANLITGTTNNPFNEFKTSGGSSGGESALLSAGASVIGVGSDIAGSIRLPAMYTGIYGHKPTPGYVPVKGHYPYSPDRDYSQFLVVGPMCRYAEDLKPTLKALAGENASKLCLDKKVDIKSLNIYFMEECGESLVMIPVDSEIKNAIHKVCKHFKNKYNIDSRKADLPEMSDSFEISSSQLMGMSEIPNLLKYPDNPKVTKNLYVEILKALFGMSQYSLQALTFHVLVDINMFIPRSKYLDYRKQRDDLRDKFISLLGDNGVFLYPTNPIPATFHNQVFTRCAGVLYAIIFNVLGMPSTNVPLGVNKYNMPIGIQVAAAPHQDRLCLAVAKELEEAFGGWIRPPS